MLWYVAIGSALGGVGRYLLGGLLQRAIPIAFPLGTLVVNLTGSALLGFLLRYAGETSAIVPEVRALLAVGLCGGYTTFSTFSYETLTLLEDGDWRRAGLYVTLSLVGSLAATFVGFALARELIAVRTRL